MKFSYNNQNIELQKLNIICGVNNGDNNRFFSFLYRELSKKNKFVLLYNAILDEHDIKKLEDAVCLFNSYLFFEYPETRLHPAKQVKFAKLLPKLLNNNNSVFILTHSDYIIRELNCLIMLGYELNKEEQKYSKISRQEIMKKFDYSKDDILDKKDVKAFHVDGDNIFPDKVDVMGFEIKSIDNVINTMNDIFDDLSEGMEIAYE